MELRKQTDCGMMECKKARPRLTATLKAIEILRERGRSYRCQEGWPYCC